MPDDMLLNIRSSLDASGIRAGATEASAALDAAADRIAAANAKVATASTNAAAAQKALAEAQKAVVDAGIAGAGAAQFLAEWQTQAANASTELAAAQQAAASAINEASIAAAAESIALQSTAAATTETAVATTGLDRAMASATGRIIGMEAGMGALGGALGRVLAFVPGLGTAFAAAFAVTLVTIFAQKIYEVYQNVVNLREALDALNKAGEAWGKKAAELNYEADISNAKLAEQNKNFDAAIALYNKAAAEKPLEFPKIDDKLFKQFGDTFVSFLQSVKTSADTPSVISRIQAEAAAVQAQIDKLQKQMKELPEAAAGPGGLKLVGGYQGAQDPAKLLQDLQTKLELLQTLQGQIQSQSVLGANQLAEQVNAINKARLSSVTDVESIDIRLTEAQDKALKETKKIADEKLIAEFAVADAIEKKTTETADRYKKEWNAVINDVLRQLEDDAKKKEGLDDEIQKHADIMLEEVRKHNEEAAKAALKWWDEGFKNLTRPLDEMVKGVLLGTQTISQAFARMGANMVLSMADALAKMLEKWLEHEVLVLAAHAGSTTAKVALDQAAADQSKSISILSTIGEITRNAAKAAAGAYAAMAGIPVVGPALGAVAAAATFAAVEAFGALASAEKGFVLPQDMLVAAHKNEMILPADISQGFQRLIAAGAGGPGGANINIHYAPAISALDTSGGEGMLERHSRTLVKIMRRAARNGAF